MQKTMPVLLHFFALVSLVLLAACSAQAGIPGTGSNATSTNSASGTSGGSSTPGASSASTASPTVFPTISVITALPATNQPAGSGTASPGSVFTATPGATETTGQGLSVTLADEGKTVKLKVGQRFLLNLGADYNW